VLLGVYLGGGEGRRVHLFAYALNKQVCVCCMYKCVLVPSRQPTELWGVDASLCIQTNSISYCISPFIVLPRQ